MFKKIRDLKNWVLLLSLVAVNPVFAYDTKHATYMQDVWNKAVDFLQGIGGMVLALLVAGMGLYILVSRGQLVWGLGMMLIGVIIYTLPNIVQGMGFAF